MRIVQLSDTAVVGAPVVAKFSDLAVQVPDAWARVFADTSLSTESSSYAEASFELSGGVYHEVVGCVRAVEGLQIPRGFAAAVVPAGRYAHVQFAGAEENIADGFRDIYDWAVENGIKLGGRKFDVGYRRDGGASVHDLYINVLEVSGQI